MAFIVFFSKCLAQITNVHNVASRTLLIENTLNLFNIKSTSNSQMSVVQYHVCSELLLLQYQQE